MVANGISQYSGEELPEEQGAGSQLPATHEIETIFCPGDRIGGYEIERVLGIGSTAVVYGASQVSTNRHVALKVPLARLSRHPRFARHFQKEAERIAPLNHPNLVNILDAGHQGELYYFVLEYVEGIPLETAVVRNILSYGDFLAVIRQVREALKYIHTEGLPHLDIKTSNIFLSRNGQVKVGDFGLAHLALALGLQGSSGEIYRAPELRAGRCSLGPQTDVYSLGMTYHRMFCRAYPENGQARASVLNPALPKAVDGVLQEAIASNPQDRYNSVQTFTVELLSSLMGMAAFFQIDRITEESDQPTDERPVPQGPKAAGSEGTGAAMAGAAAEAAGAGMASEATGSWSPETASAVMASSVASAPVSGSVSASPSAPAPAPAPAASAAAAMSAPAPVASGAAPAASSSTAASAAAPGSASAAGSPAGAARRVPRMAVAAAAAVLALGGAAVFMTLSSSRPVDTAEAAASADAVSSDGAARTVPGPYTGVLEGWLPSSHPSVLKAVEEGRPVAIYFRRGANMSLAWGAFEANVLGSELVKQKLSGVVRAVEELDGPDKPLVQRFGKGEEPVLTVIRRSGASIARFGADTTADQVAYALGLM